VAKDDVSLPRARPNQFWMAVRSELFIAAIAAFGPLVLEELGPKTPRWEYAVVVFVWISLLFFILLDKAQREEEKEEAAKKLAEERDQSEKMARSEAMGQTYKAANLACRLINEATQSLRSISDMLRKTAAGPPGEFAGSKKRMLQNIVRDMRAVFEGDSSEIDTTKYPSSFFKVALYEPEPDPGSATLLRRTFWHYPEGIEPSPLTETFEITEHARAAVVLAFKNQNIQIIEDIQTEREKDAESTRWIDRRPGQHKDYASMVCAAIVSGRIGTSGRKCLGVLVIDTNRKRYFKEERSYQAFLGTLLNPYRTMLTFVLEADAYFVRAH
jgi:hypothetical protein